MAEYFLTCYTKQKYMSLYWEEERKEGGKEGRKEQREGRKGERKKNREGRKKREKSKEKFFFTVEGKIL